MVVNVHTFVAAAAALAATTRGAAEAMDRFNDATARSTVSTNIVMDPAIRFDNVVPPMRRNGSAWQPSHSVKRKNKIRRRRAAGGRA